MQTELKEAQVLAICRGAAQRCDEQHGYMLGAKSDPNNWFPHKWVLDAMADILQTVAPKRKLEIEGDIHAGWVCYMTASDNGTYIVGPEYFPSPYAAADWCERNGFAWEVIGAVGDAVAALAAWRAGKGKCCDPTAEEKQLLASGDYSPEELWGGSRPTCPKCIKGAEQ